MKMALLKGVFFYGKYSSKIFINGEIISVLNDDDDVGSSGRSSILMAAEGSHHKRAMEHKKLKY